MVRKKSALTTILAIIMMMMVISSTHGQTTREHITIVGSYVVSPLATVVAGRLNQAAKLKKAPDLQPIGTDAGFNQFCAGLGIETPDIVLGTRQVKPSEMEECAKNGVKEIVELKIGYTAIIVTRSGGVEGFKNLTRKDLFLAMAKDVPDPQGNAKTIPNPYKTWKELNAELPDLKIQTWGPDPTYAIRSSVVSEIMVEGCKQIPWLKTLEAADPKAFGEICRSFRKDGVYNEYKDHNVLMEEMKKNPNIFGIFPATFLRDMNLTSLPIDGIEPLPGAISHNLYPLTRPLLLYVKKGHVELVPGLKDYLTEITSEAAISTGGYLLKEGLVPMRISERRQTQSNAIELKALSF